MRYDDTRCYWCGKNLIGKNATYSIGTDTLQTCRNFCDGECLDSFKKYFGYLRFGEFRKKPILPHKGR